MATKGIMFCGERLLLPDSEHQFQHWLEFALPVEDLNLFSWYSPAQVDTRSIPRSSQKSRVGLSKPNWPAPPDVRINSLYVPTGATRWAVGLFMATTDQVETIRGNLDANGFGTLELETEPGKTASFHMHLLTPRRVTGPNDDPVPIDMYLLPLVDVRYFWQFKNAGDYELNWGDSTWSSLYSEVAGDIEGVAPVSTDYFQPDPTELTRPYENSAVLLDAIAESTGTRVTISEGGNLLFLDPTESRSLLKGNLEVGDDGKRIQGAVYEPLAGMWSAHDGLPIYVEVVFQKYVKGNGVSDNERWVKTISSNQFTTEGVLQGVKKTIYTTAAADFTAGGGSPGNATDIDALANKIAESYLGWLSGNSAHFDITFQGMRPWNPTGFDDYVLYHYGCQNHSYRDEMISDIGFFAHENAGEYVCYTRACSLPLNFGASEQLQQTWNVKEPFLLIRGQLTEDITNSTSTTDIDNIVVISGGDPREDTTSTSETVEVNNDLLGGAGVTGADTVAFWDKATKAWQFLFVHHTAVDVITSWRVDGATQKLQYKTTSLAVMKNGAETDWIDAHTGTEECPEP